MKNSKKKIIVEYVENQAQIDLFPIALAIANKIKKEGLDVDRRKETLRAAEGNRSSN